MKKPAQLFVLLACLGAALFAADLPRPAPELLVALPDGKTAKLSDYRGDVVIVAFILTT